MSLIHSVKPIFEFPPPLPTPHPSQRLANGVLYNDSRSITMILYFAPNNLWGGERGKIRSGGRFMKHVETRQRTSLARFWQSVRESDTHATMSERQRQKEKKKNYQCEKKNNYHPCRCPLPFFPVVSLYFNSFFLPEETNIDTLTASVLGFVTSSCTCTCTSWSFNCI